MTKKDLTIQRGDRLTQVVLVRRSGFDFTGTTWRAHVRGAPDGPKLVDATVIASAPSAGEASVTISLTGVQTSTLPERCVLELEGTKDAASFGPKTVLRIHMVVDPDYTHD